MNKIKCVLVDNDCRARKKLRYLLEQFSEEIVVLEEVSSIDNAVLAIKRLQPEVVFLDVEMPNKNGFMLLEEFTEVSFHVIFTTASNMHAVRAFEMNVVDYLLKPLHLNRLQNAILKVKKLIKASTKEIIKKEEEKRTPKKIAVPYKTDYAIVDINDVLCIQADRMYSKLHTNSDKEYTVAKKLSHYEAMLCKKSNFVRLHRSWIVNLNKIETYSKRASEVVLESKFKIPISKSYKENFESLFFV
ncbi:LytR/AlgR family response regulator transcription factor [Tenacibaculum sp. M341]|uniref:LytR/AlgR family response regulator transcription factor n=1 Tax=Tenacibaculum sp. M341 TaxID=2530339 RepID=UPI001049A70C|nr:LytTR family DNA-binding domain-containing protein [Tenacibaculum sp. M341]TCI93555.1 response regulator transcription factor [Tenacibaculum sp. M341]